MHRGSFPVQTIPVVVVVITLFRSGEGISDNHSLLENLSSAMPGVIIISGARKCGLCGVAHNSAQQQSTT